jgi:preprotein translocase subunit SecG
MNSMQTTILIIHTVIALSIIGLVLIQRGKGSDAGAAFGSGSSGTVFGSRGATSFFSRATAVLATAFFATSLTLAYISSQRSGAPESVLENLSETAIEAQSPVVMPADDGVPALEVESIEPAAEDSDVPALDTETSEEAPTPEE